MPFCVKGQDTIGSMMPTVRVLPKAGRLCTTFDLKN